MLIGQHHSLQNCSGTFLSAHLTDAGFRIIQEGDEDAQDEISHKFSGRAQLCHFEERFPMVHS